MGGFRAVNLRYCREFIREERVGSKSRLFLFLLPSMPSKRPVDVCFSGFIHQKPSIRANFKRKVWKDALDYGIISCDIILALTGFCVHRRNPGAKFRRRHTVSGGHGILCPKSHLFRRVYMVTKSEIVWAMRFERMGIGAYNENG